MTLGEELWIAQQSDEVEAEDEDPTEDDLYVGTGRRSKKRGFLAHGGGGGKPIFMGLGNVEGIEEHEQSIPEDS